MLRTIIFWSHLIIGLIAGLVVFILCLTGGILAFELQLVDYLERDSRARPPAPAAELLPPADILASAAKLSRKRPLHIEWASHPDMPVRVRTDKRHVLLFNGYTGEFISEGATGLREFMGWVTDLHVSLTAKITGHWIVAAGNTAFVFIILSGLWLWWPRKWRWKPLRNSIALRFDVKGKARDWNWHNALGFWFLLPLLFISLTGFDMSWRTVDTWWRRVGGDLMGPSHATAAILPAKIHAGETWHQWLSTVQQHQPGWRSIVLQGNGTPDKHGIIALQVLHGTFRHVRDMISVKMNTQSGQITVQPQWSAGDGPSRARSIVRLGHTGEIVGIGGQIFAFLSCLAGLILVYTGFALSWRRFVRSKKPTAATIK